MSEENTQEAIPQTNGVAEAPVAEVENTAEHADIANDPAEPVAETVAEVEDTERKQTWLDRVKEEESELTIKVNKLKEALDQKKVPADQEHILKMQLSAMISYQQILLTRIKAAG